MRVIPLRRRLLVLAIAGILPLAAASGLALLALVHQSREQAERSALELTRALAIGVDGELQRVFSGLEALATATPLDHGDMAGFYQRAQRVLGTQPNWLAVNLVDLQGRMTLNTSVQPGNPLPALIDQESFEAVVQTRRPAVGRLAKGVAGRYAIAMRVPVVRNDELRYVLTAVVRPEAITGVLTRQRVPEDWVVSVFDGYGSRVARSRAHEQYIGTPAAPSLTKLMENGAAEGWGPTYALEGDLIYTAYTRLPHNRWSVAVGIPARAIDGPAYRSAAIYGGGIAVSLLLGGVMALWAARRVNRPMEELRGAAEAMGRGTAPALPATDIAEIRAVAEALAKAQAERRRAEEERDRVLSEAQQARAAAEQANRAKDEFLAMLGHELRNPLGAISNSTRMLEHARATPEDVRQAREIIARQVEHLARMTDDLLEAGRAMTGKIALQRRPVDLAAAAAATLATLAPRAGRHRLAQDLREAWVEADPTRLEQIIANLVGNALKYTPARGHVRVSVAREREEAVLRVADEGIGMPPELTRRVFDLFVQGERALDRSHGGLGIGLTLVKRLAELHGGTAEALSAGPGKGSEFIVRLPAIAAPSGREGAHPPASAASRDILLVEDNADARETLKRLLELGGHRVRSEPDGEAGLEAALAAPPELALIDIGLPKIDGYELARRMRSALGERTPVLIAITGYGLENDRSRTKAAGFDAHLVKPVTEAALQALLASAATPARSSP